VEYFWLFVIWICGLGQGACVYRWVSKFLNGDYRPNKKKNEGKDEFPLFTPEINNNM